MSSAFLSRHVVLLLASNSPSNSPGSQIFHWHRRGSVSQVLWRGGRSDNMKFIELHLSVEAGKHNMHTDSEELSDSVSFDGWKTCWLLCLTVCLWSSLEFFLGFFLLFFLFWQLLLVLSCGWSLEVNMFVGLLACLRHRSGFALVPSRLAVWWRDYVPCPLDSVSVFSSESCEGGCRWLNRTLYNG